MEGLPAESSTKDNHTPERLQENRLKPEQDPDEKRPQYGNRQLPARPPVRKF
jgi:hypothetical protein